MEQDLNILLDAVAKNVQQLTESITELIGHLRKDKRGRGMFDSSGPDQKSSKEGQLTITDGYDNIWDKQCPNCHEFTRQVVRPGKIQCANCNGTVENLEAPKEQIKRIKEQLAE